MKSNLSAHKIRLSQEDRNEIYDIDGIWCLSNEDNGLLVLEISHLIEHEQDDEEAESLHEDAVKAAAILDKEPSLVGWRDLDLLLIAIK